MVPAIAIHGGAGTLLRSETTPALEKLYLKALNESLDQGYAILKKGGSAIESVSAAVCSLEDCELFNAGKGSVFTRKGAHEMDAAIMEGKHLRAGAVAGIRGIKNPILLAQQVMDHSQHVLLAGMEALEFATQQHFQFLPESYFFSQQRFDQWQKLKGTGHVELDHSPGTDEKFGTVGAVAVDDKGNVAAATSTGGMTNKAWGRIGDSPIIGAGTYANNRTCAISCTGHGEYFIRAVAAYDVSCLIEYKGLTLARAANEVINQKLKKMGADGGLIAIDNQGNVAMPFNCEGMYRGMKNARETLTAIY